MPHEFAMPPQKVPSVLIAVTQAALARQLIQLARQIASDVRIELVRHGDEALERCLALRPTLVIADLALPVMGGVALLGALRQQPGMAGLPVLLVSEHPSAEAVRAVAPLNPLALLTLPLNQVRLLKLLHNHLLDDNPLPATLTLEDFLALQRESSANAASLKGVRRAVGYCLKGEPSARLLRQLYNNDWGLQDRIVEHAGRGSHGAAPGIEQAVAQLGLPYCFNLLLEQELERAVQLADPRLTQQLLPYLQHSRQCAALAAWLSARLRLDAGQSYLCGLLLSLGEFAVAHSLQAWQDGGRELSDEELKIALELQAARFGSAIRIGWRLPIPLRESIAGFYGLKPGVHSREALILNLTHQLLSLGDLSPLNLAEERAVRMLGVTPQILQAIPEELLQGFSEAS